MLQIPLAPIGGEGWGEGADSRALAETHLTLPRLRRGPLPLPLKGGEGNQTASPFRGATFCPILWGQTAAASRRYLRAAAPTLGSLP